MANYTKTQIQEEISKLCADIDKCISDIVKGRLDHDTNREQNALNRMEGLMTGVQQDLTCINDFLNNLGDMNSADGILTDAKARLKSIITENVKKIYRKQNHDNPDFFAGEDWTVEVGDFDCEKLKFSVNVSDLQTDYEGVEERTVTHIKVAADNAVFLDTEEEEDNEYDLNDLSTDEIADVARWCEFWANN